jgi:hypothetical protein
MGKQQENARKSFLAGNALLANISCWYRMFLAIQISKTYLPTSTAFSSASSMTPCSIRRRLQSVIATADAERDDSPAIESLPTKSSSIQDIEDCFPPALRLNADFHPSLLDDEQGICRIMQ